MDHTKQALKEKETGVLLGISLIGLLAFFLWLSFYLGVESGPIRKNSGHAVTGIYIQLWGMMFLLSYYYSHKTFFFRWLIWICENFSHPKGRKMAFFYFFLGFGLGTFGLLSGLGVIEF